MIMLDGGTKGAWKKTSKWTSKEENMEKREYVAKNGDGVVTMKTHEKNEWNSLHVNGNMAVRLGKACIPLINHW